MSLAPTIRLRDGNSIPQLGLGVWQVSNEQVVGAIHEALKAGYRAIDTAAIYGNESGVGKAIHSAEIPREELFITTKVWNDQQGYDKTQRAIQDSLKRLRLDYVDLYLIHWPSPRLGTYVDTWRALIQIQQAGLAKSIGVSNFSTAHLQRIIDETDVTPVINQIELHPRLQQKTLREFHAKHQIATESWSPLGRGQMVKDKTVKQLAGKYGKTPAQIVIRWHMDNGLVVIPKSVTPSRIRENIDVFDFQLSSEDLAELARLDQSQRLGPDPDTFS